jgi:predicted DNA-binding protein
MENIDKATSIKIEKEIFYNCPNLSSITWRGKDYHDKDEFNKAIGSIIWDDDTLIPSI